MATTDAATSVTYVRDALDRIVERKVAGTRVARYGHGRPATVRPWSTTARSWPSSSGRSPSPRRALRQGPTGPNGDRWTTPTATATSWPRPMPPGPRWGIRRVFTSVRRWCSSCRSAIVGPPLRWPLSRSSCRTQRRSSCSRSRAPATPPAVTSLTSATAPRRAPGNRPDTCSSLSDHPPGGTRPDRRCPPNRVNSTGATVSSMNRGFTCQVPSADGPSCHWRASTNGTRGSIAVTYGHPWYASDLRFCANRPVGGTALPSLPSWLCGFDSRHPLALHPPESVWRRKKSTIMAGSSSGMSWPPGWT
jgi:hypothetical protein